MKKIYRDAQSTWVILITLNILDAYLKSEMGEKESQSCREKIENIHSRLYDEFKKKYKGEELLDYAFSGGERDCKLYCDIVTVIDKNLKKYKCHAKKSK